MSTCVFCEHPTQAHTYEAGCDLCGCSAPLDQPRAIVPKAPLPVEHYGPSLPLFRYSDGNI